ncbi:MAG: AAA family ATPase [Xenococcaceae cyanobacterium MO_188.B29]|nr:AAA family ATPase [Xenococcaceae cyanobacterium MO_188.B29]
MIFKILAWLLFGWLVFVILGNLLALIPAISSLLFFLIFTGVTLLFIYSLLPREKRNSNFEDWLGLEPQTIPTDNITTDENKLTSDSDNIPSPVPPEIRKPQIIDSKIATKSPEPELIQPQLNFDEIRFGSNYKLPDREELKAKLKKRVIGQDAAIDTLVRMVLGKLASTSKKPLVIFLPGPTGTGKTELSKALEEALETKLTRFDMGEYAESHKASNLFGSPKGYVGSEDGGALPNAIRHSQKNCLLLLFDEVEKAHQSLWRQMLAFFDEGRVSDNLGQCDAPENTICILTSNIKADKIAEKPESAKRIIKDCGYFPPEFLGRIDKVIPLLRLDRKGTAQLTVILAKKLAKDYGINLIIEQEPLEKLVNSTYEQAQEYGGRGITDELKELLGDDLFDLQAKRIYQARLIVKNDQLKVVPLLVTSN